VRDGEAVVVYDDNGNLSAARAWWLLRWAGVGDVRLLDGGLAAWRSAGLPLMTGDEPAEPVGDVTLTAGRLPSVDPDGVAALLADGALVLDARAGERYRGEVVSVDPKPGHIPGAVSAPTTENLNPDGTFRSVEELTARFEALGVKPGRPVGVYCGSGVTAAHEIAALAIAGVDDVVLYPGSWSQWATLPDRPIATGADPG
jgi:thiosulfate/3-mercaptopyruvate sulfurtransferase